MALLVPVEGQTQDLSAPPGCSASTADDTAFGHRDSSFATVIAGMWPDPAENEANTAWVKDLYAAIAPHSEAGGYINFAAADDQARVPDNFGADYARLREVKRTYDPGNLFHLNRNIVP